MVMMKDHFNDFEELKVITPVREEAASLLIAILEVSGIEDEDVSSLLQSMPSLLKAIDSQKQDNWITKYNFFLLLKTFLSTTSIKLKQLRLTVFQMFNRVLIESLQNLEDEVRIIVTEVINLVMPILLE